MDTSPTSLPTELSAAVTATFLLSKPVLSFKWGNVDGKINSRPQRARSDERQ